jgi:hypothetical protein
MPIKLYQTSQQTGPGSYDRQMKVTENQAILMYLARISQFESVLNFFQSWRFVFSGFPADLIFKVPV